MTYEQIIKELKSKQYKPVYFLMGDETYFIDKITAYAEKNILSESEKAFNLTVFYGKDTSADTVIEASRRFPMMSDYQVVILKEAQNLKNLEQLMYYTDKPLKSTILIISHKYKTLDKRKKLYKSVQKQGVIFESKKLYEDKVPGWVNTYLKGKGYTIEPKASLMLVEFLGNNLGKIANELEKLIITIPQGITSITSVQIEENIGISKDYNNIELQNALTKNDWEKAVRIITYFANNPKNNPIVLTITSLYFYFSKILLYHFTPDKSQGSIASALKINPFFVKDYKAAAARYTPKRTVNAISVLRRYDLKSKGVGNTSAPEGELLKELIYKLMH